MKTRAIDIDCPLKHALADVYCDGETQGTALCRDRIVAAAKITRNANAAARAAKAAENK